MSKTLSPLLAISSAYTSTSDDRASSILLSLNRISHAINEWISDYLPLIRRREILVGGVGFVELLRCEQGLRAMKDIHSPFTMACGLSLRARPQKREPSQRRRLLGGSWGLHCIDKEWVSLIGNAQSCTTMRSSSSLYVAKPSYHKVLRATCTA